MNLNSNQFTSLTFVSYESSFRTKTIANAFWKKTSKSWFEIINFVKLSWIQLSKVRMNQIQSWHSWMQNFFIINRFEHIESKKSIDSIIYNQNKIFVVFVRIFHDENTISNETHIKHLNQTIYFCRKSKANAKTWTRKLRVWRVMNLTNIQLAQWACNRFERTCNMFDEFAMNHKHAIDLQLNKKSFHRFIYFFIEWWLTC